MVHVHAFVRMQIYTHLLVIVFVGNVQQTVHYTWHLWAGGFTQSDWQMRNITSNLSFKTKQYNLQYCDAKLDAQRSPVYPSTIWKRLRTPFFWTVMSIYGMNVCISMDLQHSISSYHISPCMISI